MTKLALSVCSLVAVAASAHATVAYSSFGDGDTFDNTIGWNIGTSDLYTPTMGFTSASTGEMTSVDLAIGYLSRTDPLIISLYADSETGVGDLLGSWTYAPPSLFSGSVFGTLVTGGVTLTEGVKYWLRASSAESSLYVWKLSLDHSAAAYRVNTTEAVPEPATLAVLTLGALALRRRKA